MSKTDKTADPAPGRKAGASAPASREARLAEALRANLRRRKAAAKKAAAPQTGDESDDSAAAQSDAEKPANPS